MQASYRIRLCSISDVPVLQALIPLSARRLQMQDYSTAQIEGALGTVFGVDTQLIRDGTYFVAEAEAVIVGCGGWSFRKTMFGSDSAKRGEDLRLDPAQEPARIRAFFVHPDWARRGIGSEIMRQSELAAAAARFRRIEIVATLIGEVLYEKFGYRVIERYEVPLQNGLQLPVVRMTKEII
jgi:GNAT superfamily N-acetyltransferase